MSQKEIRWKLRFQNFETAFRNLNDALEIAHLNELEKSGLAWRFGFTMNLCCNTLKDYLEAEGFQFMPTPKETIRQAFKSRLIKEAQTLIDGLDVRDELSHDYNGEKFEKSEIVIRSKTFPAIEDVYQFFLSESKLV